MLVMIYGANLSLGEIGDPFGTGLISMGSATLIFTMLVSLTMINAYNLVDGMDGLAGSLALITLVAVAIVAGYASLPAVIAVTILAAIIGFLVFNFPTQLNRSARSFMGDAGSTLLGWTILWITISISQGPERLISPVHCLWFASIPIYDGLTCFVRRSLKGRSPFSTGRDHFHHTLMRGGFHVPQILGILTGLQVAYAAIWVVGHFAGIPDLVLFLAGQVWVSANESSFVQYRRSGAEPFCGGFSKGPSNRRSSRSASEPDGLPERLIAMRASAFNMSLTLLRMGENYHLRGTSPTISHCWSTA